MKTKEVEKITGLSKQTLIWYEKEGLIHPKRNENRYREYSREDVELLKLVRMLRNMNVSIDDIRQVLEKRLSVDQILEMQKMHLQQEQKELKATEERVRFYGDTKAPVLEGLQEMYEPRTNWLGREQPPEPFHIGTRPDRKRLRRLIFWNMLWVLFILFLAPALMYRFEEVWEMHIPFWVFVGWSLVFMTMILFGFGIPQIGIGNFIQRYLDYVELSRDGIAYIKADTFGAKLGFVWRSFLGKEALVFVPYEQIRKVTVFHNTKYMTTFTNLFAYELYVTSFIFAFQNGTSYSIFNRLFYGNDEEIIIRILQEKVKKVTIKEEP